MRTIAQFRPGVRRSAGARSVPFWLLPNTVLAALIAFTLWAFYVHSSGVPGLTELLGLGIVCLGLLPAVLYFRDPNRPPAPFLPLAGLFYVVAFGFPAFYDPNTFVGRFHEVDTEALALVCAGLVSLYVCYYGARIPALQSVPALDLKVEYTRGRLRAVLWSITAIHIAGLMIPDFKEIPSLHHFTYGLGYVATGMFVMLWLEGALSPIEKLVMFGLAAPLEVLLRLTTGAMAEAGRVILFAFIAFFIKQKRIPWKTAAIVLACFAVFNEAKMTYRALTWYEGPYENAPVLEKARLFLGLAIDRATGSNNTDEYTDHATSIILSRMSHLGFLSHVVEQTPGVVPYWKGESYANFAYVLIPRALWPGKPVERLGYEFSLRYGMRSPRDESTSFNVPWIVEMYANFGWYGVLIGMGLAGVAFALLEAHLNRRGMPGLEVMIGVALLFDLCYQESNLTLMAGLKVLLYFAFVVFFKVATWRWNPRRTPRRAMRALA
jgi:hypothetical protein